MTRDERRPIYAHYLMASEFRAPRTGRLQIYDNNDDQIAKRSVCLSYDRFTGHYSRGMQTEGGEDRIDNERFHRFSANIFIIQNHDSLVNCDQSMVIGRPYVFALYCQHDLFSRLLHCDSEARIGTGISLCLFLSTY